MLAFGKPTSRSWLSATTCNSRSRDRIVRSPSESALACRIAPGYYSTAAGKGPVSAIARELRTNRPKVERCIDKGLQLGAAVGALTYRARGVLGPSRPRRRPWVVSWLASNRKTWVTRRNCGRPGYWRVMFDAHCEQAVTRYWRSFGTISPRCGRSWRSQQAAAARIEYYLEKPPEFTRNGPSAGVVQTG